MHEHLVRFLSCYKVVFDQAHQQAASEVLVALNRMHIGWHELCPRVKLRRKLAEVGTRVVRHIVHGCGAAVIAARSAGQQIDWPVGEVLGTFGGNDDHRRGAVIFLAAVIEMDERLN